MVYKEIIDALVNVFSRFKGVNYVKYQDKILNNAQNNNDTLQVYIDDVSYHQFNLTANTVKAEYTINILGFPTKEYGSILDVQDHCYNVAINALAYLDNVEDWQGIISVYDYSILTLTHYTDDNSAGVRLTLVLSIPNGVNFCELDDNFNAEPYSQKEDKTIDITTEEVPEIELIPVKLPKRNRKC